MKLLIAEDELATREGLLQCIPKEELGLTAIYAASNGLAAYDLAMETLPDIVLCDIRMPKMNGIELATRLRSHFADIQIIFISGYADKAYLKAAISLQAGGYIEKPIDEDELLQLLRETAEKVRARRKSESDTQRLTEHANSFARQQLLYTTLRNPAQIDGVLRGESAVVQAVVRAREYATASINLHWTDTLTAQAIDAAERQIAAAVELRMPQGTLCGVLTGTQLGVLLYADVLPAPAELRRRLKEALDRVLQGYTGLTCAHACIGRACASVQELSSAYQQASAQAKWAAFASPETVSCALFALEPAPLVEDCQEAFSVALQAHDFIQAKGLVQRLTDTLSARRNGSIDAVRRSYEALLGICLDFSAALEFDSGASAKRMGALSSFARLPTLQELSRFLLVRIDELLPRLPMPGGLSPKVEQALLFIERNLANPALSIQSIAESLYLTENYLCALYKRETGHTLHKTITHMRIERAKFFLRRGVRPTSVAERVGFTSPNYFSAVFKKAVGRSPAEYQRAAAKEAQP